jgi:DnaJ-class molecular chaperone
VNKQEAKVKYRQLYRKYHPDKVYITGLTVEEANAEFQQINNAYEVVKHLIRA